MCYLTFLIAREIFHGSWKKFTNKFILYSYSIKFYLIDI